MHPWLQSQHWVCVDRYHLIKCPLLCKTAEAQSGCMGIGCEQHFPNPATNSLLGCCLAFDLTTPEHSSCWLYTISVQLSPYSLSCWEINLLPWCSSFESSCRPVFILPSTFTSLPGLLLRSVPTAWCCHHNASWCDGVSVVIFGLWWRAVFGGLWS